MVSGAAQFFRNTWPNRFDKTFSRDGISIFGGELELACLRQTASLLIYDAPDMVMS